MSEVLVETSRELPLVNLTVAERTGAIEDPPGKEGLSRLVARLMRRTAAGLTPFEIDVRIDQLGAALGSEVTHSVASFQGTTITRSLDAFVDLLADVLARPALSEPELQKLVRESVGEIIESRDNDRALARRWFSRRMFQGHPYGRSLAGTIPTLRSITRDDVVLHHRRTCVAGNLVVAFAGDIDRERAEAVAARLTSGLAPGTPGTDRTPEPAAPDGRRLVVVDKPERTQTQILIGGTGTHPRDADHVALAVANTIFGGTFTARLTREVRSKRGWSYGAYSSLPYDRRRQAFSLWTFPKAADAAPCIRLELELLGTLCKHGVTKRELDFAKRYLVRSHAFAIDTAQKRCALLLEANLYDLPEGYHEQWLERVQSVTLEQANQAVRARISPENLLVTVVGTEAEIGSAVRDAIDGLAGTEVIAFDAD